MALVFLIVLCFAAFSALRFEVASACVRSKQLDLFMNVLQSQCPASISPIPVLEVDGSYLDRLYKLRLNNGYTSVLFYASGCPFSRQIRPKFDTLSSMFPQLRHLAIKQSSALPSVFSRYGVHRLPTILIINKKSKARYRGPKTLPSLAQFYKKATGLEPVPYLSPESSRSSDGEHDAAGKPSLEALARREPYLLLSLCFLVLRALVFASPPLFSRLKALRAAASLPHFNTEIFGETSQLFVRALLLLDVRRIWTNLTLCKVRSFHGGAINCRAWASSLASVSLGESSSAARM